MKQWLQETHSRLFELFRHFLLHFFDSDLITASGQTTPALIGVLTICAPWTLMIIDPLRFKYAHFSRLPTAGPYREAVRADELWLITLVMSSIGLLTAIKWQGLFPGLRDYRALASLPVGRWRVFAAKCMAILVVATAAIVVFNAIPSMLFPAVSSSRWAINRSLSARVLALGSASAAASYFFFAAMVALEGVLLNVLKPRVFERISRILQGLLVAAMLILGVLSFSIQAQVTNALLRPELARWLPPLWFLGLNQAMLGDSDPVMQALAHTARMALPISLALASLTYLVSYRRHRRLLVEAAGERVTNRRWTGAMLELLARDPRQQAIISFILKTLAGSGRHRMILTGYAGFGMAILLSGLIGMPKMAETELIAACFVYVHVILLVFLLIGLRHLFSVPAELGANWAFRVTEREGRRQWMAAVDRLALISGAAVMLAIPLPAEFRLLGWRAAAECGLSALFGLLCYESVFISWEKLPFTCSYLPGKTPAWIVFLQLLGLVSVLPVVCAILIASLYNRIVFAVVAAILLAAWGRIHAIRKETWGEVPLMYEDLPEPEIRGLQLGK